MATTVLNTAQQNILRMLAFVKDEKTVSDVEYAPFEVALSDVYGIYRVLRCLSIK